MNFPLTIDEIKLEIELTQQSADHILEKESELVPVVILYTITKKGILQKSYASIPIIELYTRDVKREYIIRVLKTLKAQLETEGLELFAILSINEAYMVDESKHPDKNKNVSENPDSIEVVTIQFLSKEKEFSAMTVFKKENNKLIELQPFSNNFESIFSRVFE